MRPPARRRTPRPGTARAAAGAPPPRRARPRGRRAPARAGREHLHGDQRGQQGDRDQVRDPLDHGSLEDPRRDREPGELQQVAADAGHQDRRPHHRCASGISVGSGPRVRSPASSATPAAARTGTPAGATGTRPRATAAAATATSRLRRSREPRPEQGEERRADRGVEPVGAGVADRGAGHGADQREEVPEHEDRDAGGQEPDPRGRRGRAGDRHRRRLVDEQVGGRRRAASRSSRAGERGAGRRACSGCRAAAP